MWLLWTVTVLLVLFGVLGIIGAATTAGGSPGAGGLAFFFVLAGFAGSGAWAVGRGGQPGTAANLLPAAAAGPPRDRLAQGPRDLDEWRPPGLPADEGRPAGAPPADPAVRYREPHSQFPVAGGPVASALLAGSTAGLVLLGGPNSRGYGPLGALLVLMVIGTVLFLVFMVLDLPNGIEISGGRFTVGVQGGRPRGRLRRRITGPLDAVRSWDVLTPAQVRRVNKSRPTRSTSGRQLQYAGDLRLLGRSGVLRMVIPPGAADVSFPAHVLSGSMVVPATQAGAIWDGVILICTRRPAALAAALEQALPGRRGTPGSRA